MLPRTIALLVPNHRINLVVPEKSDIIRKSQVDEETGYIPAICVIARSKERDIKAAWESVKSDKDYICKVFEEAIKAGATTVAFADTVGINMPQEYEELVRYVKANTPGIDDAIFSVHCHNDLGVATANTIAGVCAGARQVEVTINGLGERSGNAPLEEVVMALKCRGAYLMGDVYTRIDRRQIMATSKMVRRFKNTLACMFNPTSL
ncbi:hypothetical protein YC2023_020515 [Brassica napus]